MCSWGLIRVRRWCSLPFQLCYACMFTEHRGLSLSMFYSVSIRSRAVERAELKAQTE